MGTQRFLDGSLEVQPGTRMKHPTTSNFYLTYKKDYVILLLRLPDDVVR